MYLINIQSCILTLKLFYLINFVCSTIIYQDHVVSISLILIIKSLMLIFEKGKKNL